MTLTQNFIIGKRGRPPNPEKKNEQLKKQKLIQDEKKEKKALKKNPKTDGLQNNIQIPDYIQDEPKYLNWQQQQQ